MPVKFLSHLKLIFGYVLTVGLSGGLLFIITYFGDNQKDEMNNIRREIDAIKTELILSKKVNNSDFENKTDDIYEEIRFI
jgi:hypothetical protein